MKELPKTNYHESVIKSSIDSKQTIDNLKNNIDLVELIRSHGVILKKQGKNYIGKCPFHNDKTPSLTVTPSKNLWNCLGECQRGGSTIDWVMMRDKVDVRTAIETLKQQFPHFAVHTATYPAIAKSTTETKTESPSEPQTVTVSPQEKQTLLKKVISYYHKTLKENKAALEYLSKRGLNDPKLIDHFQLGFANRTISREILKSKESKTVKEKLTEIGIYRESGHEHFNGSLVIPIIGTNGDITEIYGRKINNKLRAGTPYHLYLKGPHEGIFNPECLQSKEIILCESVIDALSFWIKGYRNVTCSYGTGGFTQEHLDAFVASKIEKVYIAYDSDRPGDAGTAKVAEKLLAQGISCYRVDFKDVKDANEFICSNKYSDEALSQLIKEAAPLGDPQKEKITKKEAPAAPENQQPQNKESQNQQTQTQALLKALGSNIRYEWDGDDVLFTFEDRMYRVKKLKKNLSADTLRISIRAARGDRLHIDTVELCNARQRNQFIRTTATELGMREEIIRRDVGKMLLKLEEIQMNLIQEALNPPKKEVKLSPEEYAEAMAFLKTNNLKKKIMQDFVTYGLVGEDTNAFLTYLSLTSRKLDDPIAIIIQSLSGAGKSSLMNAALAFMPEEDVIQFSAMTGQSLFYMGEDNLMHKILAISEEEGAEKASYAIKIMQSEKQLKIASTGKDPRTGKFVTHEYYVKGPVQIILTTTALEIDEELQNRCIIITVNENRLQTQAILNLQRYKQTLEGMLEQQKKEKIIRLHQNAQRLLEPLMVVNPYAEKLTFLDTRIRCRRDHVKYLNLIRAIALLHQYQRPIKEVKHDNETVRYIEATREDIATANELMNEVMGTSLDEFAPQTRRFLNVLTEMVKEHCESTDTEQSEYRFTRKMIRDHTGWTDHQVRTHLSKLVDMEYVLIHGGRRGKSYTYELIYSGQGKNNQKFAIGLVNPAVLV